MRVLIVNTSERTGGAAVAAGHLSEALQNSGVRCKMLVRDKQTDRITVVGLPGRWWPLWCFLWERLVLWLHLRLRRRHLFEIDTASMGYDITGLPEFREADIIHLHWINQGMLSLRGIEKILASGKPVVWTMHDIWPATAICHVALDCRRFETGCCHCPLLPGGGGENNLAARTWRRKRRVLRAGQVTFVACSEWLAGEARKSALLAGHRVYNIPNPIDTRVYCPGDRTEARRRAGLPAEGRIILFASQRVTNENKGMAYLAEACRLLARQHPGHRDGTYVAILGGHAEELACQLPFDACPLGYVNDERRIVDIYRAADVFVLPSLSENLPNTIMEAMACGVPSVAFRTGGVAEEIDHLRTGYVADYRSSEDLCRGIWWALHEADTKAVASACLAKVARCYSQQSVARSYLEIYENICSNHHV